MNRPEMMLDRVKQLDQEQRQALFEQAATSPRLRAHRNLHDSLDEPVQRLLIALQQGTYVRPHRHTLDHQWELLVLLQGALDVLFFDDSGQVLERITLSAQTSCLIELPAKQYHSLCVRTPDTLILEIKQGPYQPESAEFATWAPGEGEKSVKTYLQWLENAKTGENYPITA